ncbi:hypothetical protein BOX15_Mlig006303g1 [Macrostomum lignano]|uniref:mRNA m(6)A methyltransferase n=1 Tax=Macrostomum lignano TaxID=282301 RepID=A0A267EQK1_9PLAT|nr:hypothetical protein BOX15_Mlig006303g1 [Macrostomum lignano]
MSSDLWKEIQQARSKNVSLRERREKRKLDSQAIIAQAMVASKMPRNVSDSEECEAPNEGGDNGGAPVAEEKKADELELLECKEELKVEATPDEAAAKAPDVAASPLVDADDLHVQQLEQRLLEVLEDLGVTVDLPVSFAVIFDMLAVKFPDAQAPTPEALVDLLEKQAAQGVIVVVRNDSDKTAPLLSQWMVSDCRHNRLTACLAAVKTDTNHLEESTYQQVLNAGNLESLLSLQTLKERQATRANAEIAELLHRRTFMELQRIEKFKSRNGALVRKFCDFETREQCEATAAARHGRTGQPPQRCSDLHFRRIVQSHTDTSLGDCSFLNTCFHIDTCKYVHYEIDADDLREAKAAAAEAAKPKARDSKAIAVPQKPHYQDEITLYPPQWIQCDIRHLDMTVLGKFAVIMGDPPWDIHMELPYGTMSDHEMKSLDIPCLQDSGYIFLWVTGRAIETGRDCLRLWGYKIIGELIWVKTNQLQRIIRTGRTGHWLNHGKEHCIIGVKGSPKNVNLGLDCDVIVSEVRATSHKPDEIYGIIERLSPGTRKLELFGRPHNVQPNWITLGNQLDGVKLIDPDVVAKFRAKYPDGVVTKPAG